MLSSLFNVFMSGSIIISYAAPTVTIVSIILAFFLGTFLYWRGGRRELIENQTLFDVVATFLAGAFIFGRLAVFIVRSNYYNWSPTKFIFFNTYWGLDIYGAFLGGVVAVWFYLRAKKQKFWDIFDFAASGLAMAFFLYLSGLAASESLKASTDYLLWAWAFCYLLLFWAIKRLEKQKRHGGFFAGLFLTFAALVNLVFILLGGNFLRPGALWPSVANIAVFVLMSFVWYLLAKRKFAADTKGIFGGLLLIMFKVKRVLTNVREADNSAKVIVLSPLYLVKALYYLVKYVGREVRSSFVDLVRAFGVGQ